MKNKTTEIHQIYHGYDGGHRRLAGSIKLLSEDSYLIDRISDLSGSLLGLKKFDPYYTGYPLSNKEYYALAKTWLDSESIRSGTVLTHTLLIPIILLQKTESFNKFTKYFDEYPNAKNFRYYESPVMFPFSNDEHDYSSNKIQNLDKINVFVEKYFGLGQRPILFLDYPNPLEFVILLMNNLWPSIRSEFSFCTLSLQYRSLKTQPFDILFAPASRKRKHQEISKRNIIEYFSEHEKSLDVDDSFSKSSDTIFISFSNKKTFNKKYPSIWKNLKSDPQVINALPTFDELMSKRKFSKSAYLGILDLLTHMIFDVDNITEFQNNLIMEALNQVGDNDCFEEELTFLNLLYNKIEKQNIESIKDTVWYKFITIVEKETEKYPREAMLLVNKSIKYEFERLSYFDIGVFKGLLDINKFDSEKLLNIKPEIIFVSPTVKLYPELISSYYKRVQSTSIMSEVSHTLANSIISGSIELKDELFIDLLLESGRHKDDYVFKELLRKANQKNIANIIDSISLNSDILYSETILNLCVEYVSKKYPEEILKWGNNNDYQNPEMLALVSAAYKFDEIGFIKLLELVKFLPAKRIGSLYYYYKFNYGTTIPDWYIKNIQKNDEFLAPLVTFCKSLWPDTKDFILNLIEDLTADLDLPGDKYFSSSNDISDSQVSIYISNIIAINHINNARKSGWRKNDYKKFFNNSFYKEWFGIVSEDDFNNTILNSIDADFHNWENVWKLLEILPKSFYLRKSTRNKKHILIKSIDKLLNIEPKIRVEKITKTWIAIISRSKELKLNNLHFALCDQALDFSFTNTQLFLSAIVRETFPTIYLVAYEDQIPRSIISRLFWNSYRWDKAKDLRKKIVSTFLDSKWPPEDLALSMPNRETFRLIFKRIYFKSIRGQIYLDRMKNDLEKLNNKEANSRLHQLNEMLENPDFYVPWD